LLDLSLARAHNQLGSSDEGHNIPEATEAVSFKAVAWMFPSTLLRTGFELRLRMKGSFAGVPRQVAVMLTRLIYGFLLGD
jgi:hypothetical protein